MAVGEKRAGQRCNPLWPLCGGRALRNERGNMPLNVLDRLEFQTRYCHLYRALRTGGAAALAGAFAGTADLGQKVASVERPRSGPEAAALERFRRLGLAEWEKLAAALIGVGGGLVLGTGSRFLDWSARRSSRG